LSELAQLKSLELSRNRVQDISPLAPLVRLELLFFDFNEVESIEALRNLNGLFRVRANSNLVRLIGPLLDMAVLVTVDLRNNPLDEDGLEALLRLLDENKVRVAL
jgi:Leucine-rich repeat (LRR) protein